jgi:hypothetical protein
MASQFAEHERRHLLSEPGIGPMVITRLEQAGFHSLATLREAGADHVVKTICARVGSRAWANRRDALDRALRRRDAAVEVRDVC